MKQELACCGPLMRVCAWPTLTRVLLAVDFPRCSSLRNAGAPRHTQILARRPRDDCWSATTICAVNGSQESQDKQTAKALCVINS